ncbi:MAG: hypothetical protein V3V08_06570 [Nannocystaceae bacterium]
MGETRAVPGSWQNFAAFQVFGDYAPIGDFFVVVRLVPDVRAHTHLLGDRARDQEALDPQLGQLTIRAGLWLAQTELAAFVYATAEECLVLLPSDSVRAPGRTLVVHDMLTSMYAARLARLAGAELPVSGSIYELPSLAVVRRVFAGALDVGRSTTLGRSARRLQAQLRGRGQALRDAELSSPELQASLLETHGVKVDSLPQWWWTGVAARRRGGDVEIFDRLPEGGRMDELVQG